MLRRARETTDKLSPSKPLRMLREQAQKIKATGNKKNTYRETMGMDKPKPGSKKYKELFRKEFAAARRAGKDSFVFSLDGKRRTTKRQDELDKLEMVGPNKDMNKAYREIRIKTGDFGKGKKKSESKRKNTQVAKN